VPVCVCVCIVTRLMCAADENTVDCVDLLLKAKAS